MQSFKELLIFSSLNINGFVSMKNKKEFYLLSFAVIVVMVGFGMVIPILPFYIENMGAGGFELGILVAIPALLEFLFSPMWGSISDHYGRKPILIVGLFGYAVSAFFFGISTEMWMLFAARALSGVLSSATITSVMAYVSDITSDENRGDGMGKIGAAMAMGLMIGPGLGGWFAEDSLSTPFFIAAGMSTLSLLLVLIFLPESVSGKSISTKKDLKFPKFKSLVSALKGPIGFLLLLVTLFSFALTNFEAIFGLYALEKFGFGPEQVGTILVVVAVVSSIGKALFTGPVTRKWGEVLTIRGSLIVGSIGYLVLLFAWDYYSILIATAFFILSKTLLRPAAFALISKRSGESQGIAMGLSNSFMSLGRIIGPIWAGLVFDINLNLPYVSGSVFMLIGFFISIWILNWSASS
jgi:DHA1 family multidrug resistance protein-like MFS transporter